MKESIGDEPVSSNEAIVDQLSDEVFGAPPNLLMGLLTGLVGAVAGVVSLICYFYAWQPHYYISPDWLVFVALGLIVGFFMRLERPFFRALYHYETQRFQQADDMSPDLRFENGPGN